MNTVHIVTGADEGFTPGLLVTLASALVSLPPESPASVHVLDGGLAAATVARIRKMAERVRPGCRVGFFPVDARQFEKFRPGVRNSRMYYVRLLMGSLVPADKAIYLDADVVVLGNLADLWETDMGGKMVLAAQDRKIRFLHEDCPWTLDESTREAPYFNTGVMVVDLKRWRAEHIESRALELAGKAGERGRWYDQTVINYLLPGGIGLLPETWNWQKESFSEKADIVHFTTGKKPWLFHGPDVRFRAWRAFHTFAAGTSPFYNPRAVPGLFFGLFETLVRRSPRLRNAYVLLLEHLLRTTRSPEKKQAIAGSIAYFTKGQGGPAGDPAASPRHPALAEIRASLTKEKFLHRVR